MPRNYKVFRGEAHGVISIVNVCLAVMRMERIVVGVSRVAHGAIILVNICLIAMGMDGVVFGVGSNGNRWHCLRRI